jgi:hypothetical protein
MGGATATESSLVTAEVPAQKGGTKVRRWRRAGSGSGWSTPLVTAVGQ